MNDNIVLQEYLARGVEDIVSDSLRAVIKDPKASAFMLKFAAASRKASKRRMELEKNGEHIPSFLIASITASCNLHCAGCYSRCSEATVDSEPADQLTVDEWRGIFAEAEELGISYIILAGGEPLLRRDVIETAGEMPGIIFPVFTNGTFISEKYFDLFDRCRNLIPVMSIEGDRERTDSRRGKGIYDRLIATMDGFYRRHLMFGASVTVTKENMVSVLSDDFISELSKRGCRLIIYVEYVPMSAGTEDLAPSDAEREYLTGRIAELRKSRDGAMFLSFPGDEKESGGCFAAGRAFFHINSHGGAEPCPFSPFSDINVRDTSLREAVASRLFRELRSGSLLAAEHDGGCVLYEKREQVQALLSGEKRNII